MYDIEQRVITFTNVKNCFDLSKKGIILPNRKVRTGLMKQEVFDTPDEKHGVWIHTDEMKKDSHFSVRKKEVQKYTD